MSDAPIASHFIRTGNGVNLHYLEAGSGPVVVLLHGWSASARQYRGLIGAFADRYRMIAIDLRGHGDSEKAASGYTIRQLAKDLRDFLERLGLEDVTLLGHSMGCSVIWAYWEIFGAERLRRLVLVDQPPCLTIDPSWSDEQRRSFGGVLDSATLVKGCRALAGSKGAKIHESMLRPVLPKSMAEDERELLLRDFLKLPHAKAADLLADHFAQDWRNVIPRIDIPTLIVGGRDSIVSWESQVWIHQQIPESQLVIFEKDEGGNHFMFLENAPRFNTLLAEVMPLTA